jgi:hypothetical protein
MTVQKEPDQIKTTGAADRKRIRAALENAMETFQLGKYDAALIWLERAGAGLVELKERADV